MHQAISLLSPELQIVDMKNVPFSFFFVTMFFLGDFQVSFSSQLFSKTFEHKSSRQKFVEATKTSLSDILKCYYNLPKNGNIKHATSVNTGLLHKYFISF